MSGLGPSTTSSAAGAAPAQHKPDALRWPMRVLLVLFTTLTALGLVSLLGGADRTEQSFAWTVTPALAAAFCGAAYGAGSVLVLLILRVGRWSQARWALLPILLFTVLTLVATLLHLHKLHLHEPDALAAGAAWLWLGIYVVVPLGMIIVMLLQERDYRRAVPASPEAGPGPADGTDRGQVLVSERQPPLLTRFVLVQAVVLIVTGTLLYLNVAAAFDAWPWALTPLIGMVTGAWLVSFGVGGLLAARVDVHSTGPATAAYTTFGGLQLLAVALHPGDLKSAAAAMVYLLVAAWIFATGAWGFWLATGQAKR